MANEVEFRIFQQRNKFNMNPKNKSFFLFEYFLPITLMSFRLHVILKIFVIK